MCRSLSWRLTRQLDDETAMGIGELGGLQGKGELDPHLLNQRWALSFMHYTSLTVPNVKYGHL